MNTIEFIEPQLLKDLPSEVICRVSALMDTSPQEQTQNLANTMESLFAQSIPPEQLVLVINGPIPAAQDTVIARYQDDRRILQMTVVRLPAKTDVGSVANAGLAACDGEWIMHASDGISHPDRLAVQLDYIDKYPDVDIFSTWCEEFTPKGRRIKSSTVDHHAVVAALRWHNVLVPPSALIRASTLRRIGGYRAKFGMMIDYDLCVRLALAGAQFRVIPAELVARTPPQAGLRDIYNECRFRVFCWRSRFLNFRQFVIITLAHLVLQLLGAALRGRLYSLVRVNASPIDTSSTNATVSFFLKRQSDT